MKMNKKGFTLIELLAVIVILAVIALIATPLISNIINEAKQSALDSEAKMVVSAINNYCLAQQALDKECDATVISNHMAEIVSKDASLTITGITYSDSGVTGITVERNGFSAVMTGGTWGAAATSSVAG